MKILFTMLKEENIYPLNVELLSALAKQGGHETFLSVLEHGELDRDLKAIHPDIVAFSAKTGESNVMFDVAREIKGTFGDDVLTIMGGPHPTFNYPRMRLRGETLAAPPPRPGAQALPVEETHMDFLAVGEADEAWPELLSRLAAGAAPDDVPGIVPPGNPRGGGPGPARGRAPRPTTCQASSHGETGGRTARSRCGTARASSTTCRSTIARSYTTRRSSSTSACGRSSRSVAAPIPARTASTRSSTSSTSARERRSTGTASTGSSRSCSTSSGTTTHSSSSSTTTCSRSTPTTGCASSPRSTRRSSAYRFTASHGATSSTRIRR